MPKPKKRIYRDMKGSRESVGRASRPRKRHRPPNKFEMEQEVASTSESADKLEKDGHIDVEIQTAFGYRILEFVTVFSTISQVVKCKECDGDVQFTESNIRGLGFRLMIKCNSCDPTTVDSSPLINNKAYDINRRIVFAFRLLGIGLTGLQMFCGIMDLPKPVFQSAYDKVVRNIHCAAKAVCQLSTKNAAAEENSLNIEKGDESGSLTVSGKGTWRKQTLSSLFGISTIVGYYTDRIIDLVIKSFHCEDCEDWQKLTRDTEEYEEWRATHQPGCPVNAIPELGSSVTVKTEVEVDSLREMFTRSEELYKVKYTNYIGNGEEDEDNETFEGLVASKPYDEVIIKRKEWINQIQKKMRTSLRNVKKQNKNGEKLTGRVIDELIQHYGLAIERCSSGRSLEEINTAVWAYYYHKISQHHTACPPGTDSWCSVQKAKANGRRNECEDDLEEPLPQDLREGIQAVYQKFSSDEVLERCTGTFLENEDESLNLNSLIWSIAPLQLQSSNETEIIETAAYIAASIFNDGCKNIRMMMQLMKLTIGNRAHQVCEELDERHKKHCLLDY